MIKYRHRNSKFFAMSFGPFVNGMVSCVACPSSSYFVLHLPVLNLAVGVRCVQSVMGGMIYFLWLILASASSDTFGGAFLLLLIAFVVPRLTLCLPTVSFAVRNYDNWCMTSAW